MAKVTLLLLALCVAFVSFAQTAKRVKPGTLYNQGEAIKSPRYGMQSKIPAGWRGVLPRDTEVFLLLPDNPELGEIYVMVNEKDTPETLRDKWQKGFALDENITLKPTNGVKERGDILTADAQLAGTTTNTAGRYYVEGRCNPNGGGCLVALLTTNPSKRDAAVAAVMDFMNSITFTVPSNESPYADFDWKEFLDDKILVAFGYTDKMNKENYVNLCADGTFEARLNNKALAKTEMKGYKGKNVGMWTVKGVGDQTSLILTFKDLPVVEIVLTIKDEKVFANGERYFVGVSEKCAKR